MRRLLSTARGVVPGGCIDEPSREISSIIRCASAAGDIVPSASGSPGSRSSDGNMASQSCHPSASRSPSPMRFAVWNPSRHVGIGQPGSVVGRSSSP
jgi:hypothetical protein